jgi:hypothetical protein
MKFFTFSLVLALVTFVSLTGEGSLQSNPRQAHTRELQPLEKVRNDAHERGDADALQALWSDDLEVDVPKMPVMNKAGVLSFARSGRMKFLRYATSDIRIRTYGDTAAVSGRLQRTRQIDGKELSDDWRSTKVDVRQAQQWRGFLPPLRSCPAYSFTNRPLAQRRTDGLDVPDWREPLSGGFLNRCGSTKRLDHLLTRQ